MTTNRNISTATCVAVLFSVPALLHAYPFGPGPGFAGVPGEQTCAACHGSGINVGGGGIAVNATSYTAGVKQHLVVTITDNSARRWGFEASSRAAKDNSPAGSFQPTDGNTQVADPGTGNYIEHTSAGTRPGTAGPVTFEFDWNPPAADAGNITLYVTANAANNNNRADAGDHIYGQSFTLASSPAANGPQIDTSRPDKGIINGANFQAGIKSGSWFAIKGTNLSATTRTWRGDDIVNNKLPTQIDGVSVTVNGKLAAIYFVSPLQVNALAPNDTALGPVEVKITTAAGSSTSTATLQQFAPGFFLFTDKYPAAVIDMGGGNSILLGKPNLFPGVTTRPAKPGEKLLMFGTAFGPTDPQAPADVAFFGAFKCTNTVSIQIGGIDAKVEFAGISSPGLYQFNVFVPDALPDGDAPVVASVGGLRTQDNVFITVQK
jgi:uncharacterized protein (TIGR03437 family)